MGIQKKSRLGVKEILFMIVKYCAEDNLLYTVIFFFICCSIIYVKFGGLRRGKVFSELMDTKLQTWEKTKEWYQISLGLSAVQQGKYIVFQYLFGKQIKRIFTETYMSILKRSYIKENYGTTQNNYNIGCVGLAKCFSGLVLNVFPCFVGISILFYNYYKDFSLFLLAIVCITFTIYCLINYYIIHLEVEYKIITNKTLGAEKKVLFETLQNIDYIKTEGMEDTEIERYKMRVNDYQAGLIRFKLLSHILKAINWTIFNTLNLCVCYLFFNNFFAGEKFVLREFFTLTTMTETELNFLANIYIKMKKYIADGKLAAEYIQYKNFKRTTTQVNLQEAPLVINLQNIGVKIEGVDILQDINLIINKSDKIGVIGCNGSGKSTLMRVLVGLVDFEGHISFDDDCFTSNEYPNLSHILGYVPQKTVLFDDSIQYNILYSCKPNNLDEAIAICEVLGVGKQISNRLNGYSSAVGENGKILSGGTRQKIILARILVKKPEIFIMDEPLSQLDYYTEKKFIKYLFRENSTKTIIMSVHSKRYLKKFNRFLYVNGGQVKEIKSYEEAKKMIKYNS